MKKYFKQQTPQISSHAETSPQIKDLVANPSPSRILIGTSTIQPPSSSLPSFPPSCPPLTLPHPDVREPHELAYTGRIPTAHNLPIASSPDALFLPADAFEGKFDFPKPSHDTEVVFYCKAGVRSRAAAGMARMAGWEKVGEYEGSWVDWEGRGGEIKRDG